MPDYARLDLIYLRVENVQNCPFRSFLLFSVIIPAQEYSKQAYNPLGGRYSCSKLLILAHPSLSALFRNVWENQGDPRGNKA